MAIEHKNTKIIIEKGTILDKVLRVILTLMGIVALLGSVGFMLDPAGMEADFAVVASRTDGLGTLRGDLGGMFLTAAIFILYGSRPGKSAWLIVPTVLLFAVLFGRGIHIVLDGLTQPAIRSTLIEIVSIVILEFARIRLPALEKEANA